MMLLLLSLVTAPVSDHELVGTWDARRPDNHDYCYTVTVTKTAKSLSTDWVKHDGSWRFRGTLSWDGCAWTDAYRTITTPSGNLPGFYERADHAWRLEPDGRITVRSAVNSNGPVWNLTRTAP